MASAALTWIARRRARDARRVVLSDSCDLERTEQLHARKAQQIANALAAAAPSVQPAVALRAPALDKILHVDVESRTCVAEPGVAFVDLIAATLRHGLVPAVVADRTTLGGAVSSCSLASTSFRFGAFHDTCTALEIVTTDGDVLHCTPDGDHALLFQMLHGAPRSLGLLSKLTFQLVPAKSHVHVVHERYVTVEACLSSLRGHAEIRDVDYLDAIVHSPTSFVVAAGRSVDEAPFAHRYDGAPSYHRATVERADDFLRTEDYSSRHAWEGATPLRRLANLLQGELAPTGRARAEVLLPLSRARGFLAWYAREVGKYPIRLSPSLPGRRCDWLERGGIKWRDEDDLFVGLDIGVPQERERDVRLAIDEMANQLGGMRSHPADGSAEALRRIWHKSAVNVL